MMAGAPGLAGRYDPPVPERIALVIGNAGYAQAPLRNPANDSRAMAATLRELGFEVIHRENLALDGMLDALRDFAVMSAASQVRVFYYAGHGSQLRGRNYLIPVDAQFKDEEELPRKAASATELVERLGQMKSGVNIVILDACRNQAFPVGTRTRTLGGNRSLAKGLAQVSAPRGTLVAYSTAPGSIALDGADQRNSAYTRHLVANMQVAGLPVEQLFKRVRIAVSEETRQAQIPWETSSLMGEFCFRTAAGGECVIQDMATAANGRN
jgi:uncharacterized caspase-like protein